MKHAKQAEELVWCQVVHVVVICILPAVAAQECGVQAGGVTCPGGLCCSQYGYCGTAIEYCGEGCQSNCKIGCGGLICILNETIYDKLWPNRDAIYAFPNFYQAYQDFVPLIGREGTHEQKLREVAALAAHIQQETAGLFYVTEIDQSNSYCDETIKKYLCASGQKYFGRGPLQLSWNYNYGAARDSGIGADVLKNPDLVAQNGTLAWKASLWFWNRTDNSIPSIHDVMVGKWAPSQADLTAGRKPGFGMTINIINGGIECGTANQNAANRIKYYIQFCETFGIDPGSNLDCASMTPYSLLAQVVSVE